MSDFGWVNLGDIAQILAERQSGPLPTDDTRDRATDLLWRALRAGDFGAGWRLEVLFANSETGVFRPTISWLDEKPFFRNGGRQIFFNDMQRCIFREALLDCTWCALPTACRFFRARGWDVPAHFRAAMEKRNRSAVTRARHASQTPRGRPSDAMKECKAEMKRAVNEAEITVSELQAMKQLDLPNRFPGSRTTCAKARSHVLDELLQIRG